MYKQEHLTPNHARPKCTAPSGDNRRILILEPSITHGVNR